jgi:hypothetical protein
VCYRMLLFVTECYCVLQNVDICYCITECYCVKQNRTVRYVMLLCDTVLQNFDVCYRMLCYRMSLFVIDCYCVLHNIDMYDCVTECYSV